MRVPYEDDLQRRHRERAAQILDEEVFKWALDRAVHRRLMDILNSKSTEAQQREAAYHEARAVALVKQELRIIANGGGTFRRVTNDTTTQE